MFDHVLRLFARLEKTTLETVGLGWLLFRMIYADFLSPWKA